MNNIYTVLNQTIEIIPPISVRYKELLGVDIHPRARMSTPGRGYYFSSNIHALAWISMPGPGHSRRGVDINALVWIFEKNNIHRLYNRLHLPGLFFT